MEVNGQLYAPAVLPVGKSPWYPLYRRLDGLQILSGLGCDEKNLCPRQESNSGRAVCNLVTDCGPGLPKVDFLGPLEKQWISENRHRLPLIAQCNLQSD
jgi:hypothetical protein